MTLPVVAVAAASALFLVLLLGVSLSLAIGTKGQLRKRAQMLQKARRGELQRRGKIAASGMLSVKRSERRTLPMIEQLAKTLLPRQSVLRERISRTGLQLSIGGYLLICLGVGTVGCLASMIGLSLPITTAALIGFGAGIALPHMFLGFLGQRRRNRFIALFPDAIDLIVRGIKSGLPVSESIAAVGREVSEPLGGEFRRISDGIRFGRQLDEMLWETANKLETQEFNFFVITLAIQQETGGNLAETLGNLSDILRKRRQMRLKVKALSSEAKASAMILGSLPFLMFGLIYMINRPYEEVLLTDPRGILLLSAALGSIVMGTLVMAKLIRFEI